jgi:hypothetical protein
VTVRYDWLWVQEVIYVWENLWHIGSYNAKGTNMYVIRRQEANLKIMYLNHFWVLLVPVRTNSVLHFINSCYIKILLYIFLLFYVAYSSLGSDLLGCYTVYSCNCLTFKGALSPLWGMKLFHFNPGYACSIISLWSIGIQPEDHCLNSYLCENLISCIFLIVIHFLSLQYCHISIFHTQNIC